MLLSFPQNVNDNQTVHNNGSNVSFFALVKYVTLNNVKQKLIFYIYIKLNKIIILYLRITVRSLLSAELDYPRFLWPNLCTLNLYEIQSDFYYLHLYYPQASFIRGF